MHMDMEHGTCADGIGSPSRFAQELYEEIVHKEVPVSEWPNWIFMRMSAGEPLS